MAHLFEQQPRESAKAFAAFSLYLGLGDERSAQAVAHKLGKSDQLIRRWSAQHRWVGRVDAYAKHLAGIAVEAPGQTVQFPADDAVSFTPVEPLQHFVEHWPP